MKWIVLSIMLLASVSSCKTNTVYVPVERVRVESKDYFWRDSIYLKDSIFVRSKGDTVFVDRFKYFYKDRFIRDSVFVRDSIQVAYPVEVVKEVNRLKTWQEILIYFGFLCLGILGIRVYKIFK